MRFATAVVRTLRRLQFQEYSRLPEPEGRLSGEASAAAVCTHRRVPNKKRSKTKRQKKRESQRAPYPTTQRPRPSRPGKYRSNR